LGSTRSFTGSKGTRRGRQFALEAVGGGGSTAAAPWSGGGLCGLRGRSRRPLNSRGVSRHRVEARTALNSFVRRAGTAHRGERRSDGGLSGRQTRRTAGTRCENRGRTSRGLWGRATPWEGARPRPARSPEAEGGGGPWRGARAACDARRRGAARHRRPNKNLQCHCSDVKISKNLNRTLPSSEHESCRSSHPLQLSKRL
jgi:hypothetical protein